MSEQIMGMSIVVEILDNPLASDIDLVLTQFHKLDALLSTYKKSSEINKINSKRMRLEDISPLTKKILDLCESTKKETNGFFNIEVEKHIDPSGLVVGYAINEAVETLHKLNYKNFYITAGNDTYLSGRKSGQKWKVELPNPYPLKKRSQALYLTNVAISTSGQNTKGILVYNPHRKKIVGDILSLTVISDNSLDADRFSTASFAMGEKGIDFLEGIDGVEGFLIRKDGTELATMGFDKYFIN